ncbi:unnamed protein product [Arabidopsis thaliana]|uniref:Gb/AAC32441.1 n=1 Tax=Arabidopsis thaliana TaxID=3702 RepID=Q9FHV0_ARATH|nr:unnamed protein product [Arabidopsis thaliana]
MNTARANRENAAENIYIASGDSQLSLMDSHQARPKPVHTVCPKPPLKHHRAVRNTRGKVFENYEWLDPFTRYVGNPSRMQQYLLKTLILSLFLIKTLIYFTRD